MMMATTMPLFVSTANTTTTSTNNNNKDVSPATAEVERQQQQLVLSKEDIELVQSAWKRAMSGADNAPGLATFRQIFMQMVEIRQVFGFENSDDARFIRHTKTFCNYLNSIIANLHDRDEFDHLCIDLGRRHAYVRQTAFKIAYWDIFAAAIIGAALDETVLRAQVVWRHVVVYMIERIKEGYYSEIRANQRKPSVELMERISSNSVDSEEDRPPLSAPF